MYILYPHLDLLLPVSVHLDNMPVRSFVGVVVVDVDVDGVDVQ